MRFNVTSLATWRQTVKRREDNRYGIGMSNYGFKKNAGEALRMCETGL